ncbi:hypothetical protein V1477_015982 [Vespula maculifrons]|uniref:Uncharacterized protein n=1 Tax=Vespula maculifrons TaxID=7453 RepID=A0ABD2BBR2_VESMC
MCLLALCSRNRSKLEEGKEEEKEEEEEGEGEEEEEEEEGKEEVVVEEIEKEEGKKRVSEFKDAAIEVGRLSLLGLKSRTQPFNLQMEEKDSVRGYRTSRENEAVCDILAAITFHRLCTDFLDRLSNVTDKRHSLQRDTSFCGITQQEPQIPIVLRRL